MDKTPASNSAATNEKQGETGGVLDTRGMEPPEPILTILKRVSALEKGQELQVRLDNCPMQLYDLLQQRGFFLAWNEQQTGDFKGTIRSRAVHS